MSGTGQHQDGWQACPTGALSQFARDDRGRRRRVLLLKSSGAAALALLLVGVSLSAFNSRQSREPKFGGITCTEVRRHAAEYRAGRLNDDLASKIRLHLEQCSECQSRWKIMQAASRGEEAHAAHCSCDSGARRVMTLLFARFDHPLAWNRPSHR